MAKLVWRVKLVAELEPGVTTETEVARIERDAQASVAELRLRLCAWPASRCSLDGCGEIGAHVPADGHADNAAQVPALLGLV